MERVHPSHETVLVKVGRFWNLARSSNVKRKRPGGSEGRQRASAGLGAAFSGCLLTPSKRVSGAGRSAQLAFILLLLSCLQSAAASDTAEVVSADSGAAAVPVCDGPLPCLRFT